VFAKDPTSELGLLLPVRFEEVEPPGLLTTRVYVDLVGMNPADARAALLVLVQATFALFMFGRLSQTEQPLRCG
jgi:hypothetical protein